MSARGVGRHEAVTRIAIRATAPVIRRLRSTSFQYHFDAATFVAEVSSNIPRYQEMQAALAAATQGASVSQVLDLGIGTGETSAAVLAVHPSAQITGVDASVEMLNVARQRLPSTSVSALVLARLEDFRSSCRFDLVVSSLAVHHLSAKHKRALFERIHEALTPGGRFVMADIVRPDQSADAVTPISRVYDRPEPMNNLERWLQASGFHVRRSWAHRDLVVMCAERHESDRAGRHPHGTRLRGPSVGSWRT